MRQRRYLSQGERFDVLHACGFRCVYCGRDTSEVALVIDHVQAWSKGGADDESNFVAACGNCNSGKATKDLLIDPREPWRSAVELTLPHVDACAHCGSALGVYAAHHEEATEHGYVAWYRCTAGHAWSTSWSHRFRMSRADVLEACQ